MELVARERKLDLELPRIMGILNATPDSFSDAGVLSDTSARVERGLEMLAEGADLLDIGGESGVTNRPPVSADEEIARISDLVERIARGHGAFVSVDTYKAPVAAAALEAGAVMINDPSGLRDPGVAEACAQAGAALVVTHTLAPPKQKLPDPRYDDIVDDVKRFLSERVEQALRLGVREDGLLLCPGPDLGKNPAQTIELLRRLDELSDLELPILLSASRKDFIGALNSRRPRERLAGTLAAVAHGLDRGVSVFRLHDVAEARDFLRVRSALSGELEIDRDLSLSDGLRWEPVEGTGEGT